MKKKETIWKVTPGARLDKRLEPVLSILAGNLGGLSAARTYLVNAAGKKYLAGVKKKLGGVGASKVHGRV